MVAGGGVSGLAPARLSPEPPAPETVLQPERKRCCTTFPFGLFNFSSYDARFG